MSAAFGVKSFGSNGVVPTSLGLPTAMYPGAVASNAQLTIAVDRLQTRLAVPLSASDTQMTVINGAGIVPDVLLSIDSELVQTQAGAGNIWTIIRGRDGTAPALHLASALVSGFVDAWHHNALVSEIQAIESTLGPNLSNIPTAATLTASAYNFAPQSPGGNLAVGANVITLNPVPKGLAIGNALYISGGTGTAEAPLITGVSGTGVIVNCANAHSGAWTIRSASGGVQEAIEVARSMTATLQIAPEVFLNQQVIVYATINVNCPTAYYSMISLRGMGRNTVAFVRASSFTTGDMFYVTNGNAIGPQFSDFGVLEAPFDGSFVVADGATFHLVQSGGVLNNLSIYNPFVGIRLSGCNNVVMDSVQITWNTAVLNVYTPFGGIWNDTTLNTGGAPAGGGLWSNLHIGGNFTTRAYAQFGIRIQCMDGLQLINCGFSLVQIGIWLSPQGPNGQCSAIQISNCDVDGSTVAAFYIEGAAPAGHAVAAISIADCHAAMYTAVPGQTLAPTGSLIDIEPSSSILDIEITGCSLHWAARHGIDIGAASLKRAVIANNLIWSPGLVSTDYANGINVRTGVSNLVITGNTAGNSDALGHTTFGIVVEGTSNNLTIVGNNLKDAATPMAIVGIGTDLIITNNAGIDEVIPAVASAATIASPLNPCFSVTGVTTVTTITGGWTGVRKTLLKTDAGPVTIGGGGNVPGVHTLAQNQSITLTYNGTAWV